MASTSDQLSLIKEPQINPDFAIDDIDEAYAPDSNQKLRLGVLKVHHLSCLLVAALNNTTYP